MALLARQGMGDPSLTFVCRVLYYVITDQIPTDYDRHGKRCMSAEITKVIKKERNSMTGAYLEVRVSLL